MAQCRRCFSAVDAAALACPNCHALIHEEELERLKAQAVQWEAEGLYSQDWTGDAYRLGVNFFIYALTH